MGCLEFGCGVFSPRTRSQMGFICVVYQKKIKNKNGRLHLKLLYNAFITFISVKEQLSAHAGYGRMWFTCHVLIGRLINCLGQRLRRSELLNETVEPHPNPNPNPNPSSNLYPSFPILTNPKTKVPPETGRKVRFLISSTRKQSREISPLFPSPLQRKGTHLSVYSLTSSKLELLNFVDLGLLGDPKTLAITDLKENWFLGESFFVFGASEFLIHRF